jgi:hypothetical protein
MLHSRTAGGNSFSTHVIVFDGSCEITPSSVPRFSDPSPKVARSCSYDMPSIFRPSPRFEALAVKNAINGFSLAGPAMRIVGAFDRCKKVTPLPPDVVEMTLIDGLGCALCVRAAFRSILG